MGLIYGISALHRGADKTFATTTSYGELADYPDLKAPVADFPLRDVLNRTPLSKAYLNNIKNLLLESIREMATSWENNVAWGNEVGLREHGKDVAARILIRIALDSYFGSYLRSKVDLTGDADTVTYYDTDIQNAALQFYTRFPSLDLDAAYSAFSTYIPDTSLLELVKRVCDETKFPVPEDLDARFSICCGLAVLAYYVEGRA